MEKKQIDKHNLHYVMAKKFLEVTEIEDVALFEYLIEYYEKALNEEDIEPPFKLDLLEHERYHIPEIISLLKFWLRAGVLDIKNPLDYKDNAILMVGWKPYFERLIKKYEEENEK
jgi:sporulation-control protein spo0M